MTDRSSGRKKSQFLTSTSVPSGAYFDYVFNAVNYRISDSDLYASLGVTGTIVQAGDPVATPILDTQGAVNNIRNLEDGPGVKTSVSPQNGVVIEHNFTVDSAGVPVLRNPSASSPTIRSLVAGSGMAVSASGDQIVISSTGVPVSTKTVIVNEVSDFPAASGGVVTLEDNTAYYLTNDITTANRFVVGVSTVIRADASQIVKLEYTGSGDMFTGVDPSFRIDRVTVSCPNGNLWNISSTLGTGIVQMIECNVESCNTGGTISGQFITRFKGVAWEDIKTNGVIFSGSNQNLAVDTGIVFLNGGAYIDLGAATFNTVSILNQIVETSAGGTVFLKGAAGSANINAGGLGVVSNNRIFGSASPLSGVTVDDSLWNFTLNDDIANTRPDALLSFQTPTTTTISAVNTPTLISGTWTSERSSQMVTTAAGRVTYTGGKDATIPISASLAIEPVSGSNKDLAVYLAKNGSVVVNSRFNVVISAGSARTTVIEWQDRASQNDYYELWVENRTDAVDIQVTRAFFRID